MTLPTFLIIGVPRAATTSLASRLAAHPEIYMSARKELHFFDGGFGKGLEWYHQQFEQGAGASQLGEATPVYLYDRRALHRMSAVLPDSRLIVILRDPVDRAYSHFWLNRWRGIEPLPFEDALAAEESRLRGSKPDRRHAYVGMGRYSEQIRRLYDHYPAGQVRVVMFDDLRERPDEVVLELCRFLGVEERVPALAQPRQNHRGPARSASVAALARQLPDPLCTTLRSWNTRAGEYPPIRDDTRLALQAQFTRANGDLETLIGRPVSWASGRP